MNFNYFLLITLLVGWGNQVAAAADRPNIVIIVGDDMGYADVGFHGSKEIPTPSLDSLAAGGVRCTNGYVSHPFCSPTRAGLLTGRYQHRFGHENNPVWMPENTSQGLPLGQILLPQVMKQNGYATGHAEHALALLRESAQLRELFERLYI